MTEARTVQYLELPLDGPITVKPSPVQRKFSEQDVDNLARSIASVGLLQPIQVRNAGGAGEFEVIAGHRRLAACRKLGQGTIRAEVWDVDDTTAHAMTAAENLQRQDLTPLEQAAAIKVLRDAGQTIAQIAEQLGWSSSTVAKRDALNNLSQKWRDSIAHQEHDCHEFGASHLALIARMPAGSQDELLAWHIEANPEGCDESVVPQLADLREMCERLMADLSAAEWDLADESLDGPSCKLCLLRSDAQAELFDELAPGDGKKKRAEIRCLDPACYESKAKAYMTRRIEALRQKHGDDLRVVVPDYNREKPADIGVPEDAHVITKPYDWQECKKGDPDAKPVFVAIGNGAGTTKYMKPFTRAAAAAPKTGAESMADKRAALERRRGIALCDLVAAKLDEVQAHPPAIPSLVKLLAAPAIFGAAGKEYADRERWEQLGKAIAVKKKGGELAQALEVLKGTITNWHRGVLHDAREAQQYRKQPCMLNAMGVCAYFGWDVAKLEAEVEKKIPEPKSWAAQATGKSRGKK
jgi:ParB/RepB/Spo0J family partition protein